MKYDRREPRRMHWFPAPLAAGRMAIHPTRRGCDAEEVLSCHPNIVESAVVGVPDEDSGEKVKAVVVADPGAHLSGEQIVDLCSRHLSRYKVPKVIEFRDALPKNAAGKVLKQQLRTNEAEKN